MDPILDIRFKNGRQRLYDPSAYTTSEPFGLNVMSEFDIRWDDISEGLVVEISKQAPEGQERPEFGKPIADSDERGTASRIEGATYIYILDTDELLNVSKISYRGEVMVRSMNGELVVMAKLGELCAAYLGDAEPTYDAINALYPVLLRMRSREPMAADGARVDLDRAIALEMGISENVLAAAREYAFLKAQLECEAEAAEEERDERDAENTPDGSAGD